MIDSHCHLDFRDFDGERERIVAAAAAAGVHTIVNIGVDLETSQRSIDLAERFDAIYATVGVHPHDAKKLTPKVLDALRTWASHPRVVAIGEIGLDFYRDLSPRDIQRVAFRTQLELAIETDLPIVIHTRESFHDTLEIVREYVPRLKGGVFHCFPGDTRDALEVIDLGFVVGIGGVVTFKKAGMATVASHVPMDRIMLETDAPYLAPVPFRGKRNQPAYIPHIRDKIAEVRDVPAGEVERVTDLTTRKLFGLVETFGG